MKLVYKIDYMLELSSLFQRSHTGHFPWTCLQGLAIRATAGQDKEQHLQLLVTQTRVLWSSIRRPEGKIKNHFTQKQITDFDHNMSEMIVEKNGLAGASLQFVAQQPYQVPHSRHPSAERPHENQGAQTAFSGNGVPHFDKGIQKSMIKIVIECCY